MKKFFTGVVGGTVILFGTVLLVLPGPGALAIAAGVAILATEFLWARRAMRKAKGTVARARRKSGLRAWLRRLGGRVTVSRPGAPLGDGQPMA